MNAPGGRLLANGSNGGTKRDISQAIQNVEELFSSKLKTFSIHMLHLKLVTCKLRMDEKVRLLNVPSCTCEFGFRSRSSNVNVPSAASPIAAMAKALQHGETHLSGGIRIYNLKYNHADPEREPIYTVSSLHTASHWRRCHVGK